LKRIIKWVPPGLLGIAGLAYGFDSAALALKSDPQRYRDIRVDQVYTDTNKWNQVEYSRGDPVTERCVNALFPHAGLRPCWYVARHTMNITDAG